MKRQWNLDWPPYLFRSFDNGISYFDLWADNRLIARMHLRLLAGMLIRIPLLICERVLGVLSR